VTTDLRTPSDQKNPPTIFLGSLSHLGPGLIVTGSIGGSGELIVAFGIYNLRFRIREWLRV